MLVGPNDPIFRDPLADPRVPASLPPGARFDPIGVSLFIESTLQQQCSLLCARSMSVVAQLLCCTYRHGKFWSPTASIKACHVCSSPWTSRLTSRRFHWHGPI
jgi:PI31 proteasome regulator